MARAGSVPTTMPLTPCLGPGILLKVGVNHGLLAGSTGPGRTPLPRASPSQESLAHPFGRTAFARLARAGRGRGAVARPRAVERAGSPPFRPPRGHRTPASSLRSQPGCGGLGGDAPPDQATGREAGPGPPPAQRVIAKNNCPPHTGRPGCEIDGRRRKKRDGTPPKRRAVPAVRPSTGRGAPHRWTLLLRQKPAGMLEAKLKKKHATDDDGRQSVSRAAGSETRLRRTLGERGGGT